MNVFHTGDSNAKLLYLLWWSNYSSLEKWLILALGQEIDTISFEPLAAQVSASQHIPQ